MTNTDHIMRTTGLSLSSVCISATLHSFFNICYMSGHLIKFRSLIKERFEFISISSSLNNFGQLKADMERTGNKIDDFDLLIGATAITHDLIMVTDNVKHLGKIPGIQLENWIERV